MGRFRWIVAVVGLLLIALVLPDWRGGVTNKEPGPGPSVSEDVGRFEATHKQGLIKQDVSLTERLCRTQCGSDFRQAVGKLAGKSRMQVHRELGELRREHPHMLVLSWQSRDGGRVEHGALPDRLLAELRPYMDEAEKAARQLQTYESPKVTVNGDYYFVLAVPGDRGGLSGVVHQSILGKIETSQRKNLRLVPYPAEGRYKIESVDSDTGQDIHVDSGEENAGASHYHKQQVVVKFKAEPSSELIRQINDQWHITKTKKLGYTYVFESRSQTAEPMLDYFRKRDDVEYAEPHYLYMTNETDEITPMSANRNRLLVPNDYLFEEYQWNLPITETLPGWNITKGDSEIQIAVIDTGVDLGHPDLQGRLAQGRNLINPDKPPMDDVGHGTHVAGVISALVNNSEGIAGMTWYDKVMPVKVLDETGAGSTYSVAEGIIWATDHGAKIINMSLGNYAKAQFLHDAIRYAFDKDVVLVAATGNDNTDERGYPAAYEEVLAVSATDDRQRRAPFSNYGDYIDVVAPGVSIASTYPDNQYAALSGTSMATPHVSALAALIRSVNPKLKNTEVMDIIRKSATDLGKPGRDSQFGYGQIDVNAALAMASQKDTIFQLLPEWLRRGLFGR